MSIELYVIKHEKPRGTRAIDAGFALGKVSAEAAVIWCLRIFTMHENDYGTRLTVTDVSENFVSIRSDTYLSPKSRVVEPEDLSNPLGSEWTYEFSGTHDELAELKCMLLWCARGLMSFYPTEMEALIDTISVQQHERDLASMG